MNPALFPHGLSAPRRAPAASFLVARRRANRYLPATMKNVKDGYSPIAGIPAANAVAGARGGIP